jgi:hypothetical protein
MIRIHSTWLATLLFFAIVFLGVASLLNWHLAFRNHLTIIPVLLFDLSTDVSVPTWFSSVILLACSALLAFVWKLSGDKRTETRYRHNWLVLSVTFLLLSIDEVADIHGTVGRRLAELMVGKTSGIFYYAWVIPGMLFVLAFFFINLRFLLSLPVRTRNWYLISGAVFLAGAIGVEMYNGWYSETHGSWNIPYALSTAIEESLEMTGVAMFLVATLNYVQQQFGPLELRVVPQD